MTERDLRIFKRLMWMIPIITIVASMLMQWGAFQANSANIQKQITDVESDFDKRIERIELQKADNAVMKEKFESIDWKLDLIMKNMGIVHRQKRDTL